MRGVPSVFLKVARIGRTGGRAGGGTGLGSHNEEGGREWAREGVEMRGSLGFLVEVAGGWFEEWGWSAEGKTTRRARSGSSLSGWRGVGRGGFQLPCET